MMSKPPAGSIGYSRREFNAIFQIYSRGIYQGRFRDFSFTEGEKGVYYISFREDAASRPVITVEKRQLSAERSLFVATVPGLHGAVVEVVRSEKIDSFVERLQEYVNKMPLPHFSRPAFPRPVEG